MADVREQVDTRCHRRDVCRVGQGRELVAKVGARDDRARDHREVCVHSDGDSHECDADRASGAPGGSCTQGDDRGDDEGDHGEELWVNDLQAVVNEHRDCAASHPRSDQHADGDEDEDCGHRLRDFLRDRVHDLVPRVPETPGDQASDDSRGDEEGFDRELGEDVAAAEQCDEGDNGDRCHSDRRSSVRIGHRSLRGGVGGGIE